MRKVLFFALPLLVLLALAVLAVRGWLRHADSEIETQDAAPLVINIDKPVMQEYYLNLQKELQQNGIEVVFENTITYNSSGNNIDRLAHDDMPDIITMWAPFPTKLQKEKLLDLAQHSFLDDFRQHRLQSLDVDGAVYQVPYCSRLIGIQYNKTLFQEQGWALPRNFAELQALIPKIREAGYQVSTTAIPLSGNGFNYLFHFAGVTALYTPAGSVWLEKFLAGRTGDMSPMEKTIDYLTKLKECGFFGDVRGRDAEKVFKSRRNSAFYLDIVAHAEPYRGTLYDRNGKPVPGNYVADAEGAYVRIGDSYVAYDAGNASHGGLQRYRGEGSKQISDEYGIMPWFNEAGDNNCFCLYNNFYISLNRTLGEPENHEKLEKALKALEYVGQGSLGVYFKSEASDTYMPLNSFRIDETRCYYEYADSVKWGYLMPWYYPRFEDSVIVAVGKAMNNWLSGAVKEDGKEYTGKDVLDTLWKSQSAYLATGDAEESLAQIAADFSVEETARFMAYSMALGLQKHFAMQPRKRGGSPLRVDGALMAYRPMRIWQPGGGATVCTSRLYKGDCDRIIFSTILPQSAPNVDAVYLTGTEIRALQTSCATLDHEEVKASLSYPCVCVLRDDVEFHDDREYLMAIPTSVFSPEFYKTKQEAGKYVPGQLPLRECMENAANRLKYLTPEQFQKEQQTF